MKHLKHFPGILLVLVLLIQSCAAPIHIIGVQRDQAHAPEVISVPAAGMVFWEKELYQKRNDNIKTALPIVNDEFAFSFGDFNADKAVDLYAVNPNGFMASDLYILSGETGYQTFLYQYPLAIPKMEQGFRGIDVADWNLDHVPDLFVFKQHPNGYDKRLVVYIYSGASNAQYKPYHQMLDSFNLQTNIDDDNVEYKVQDFNNDLIPDLFEFHKSYSNNKLGVKIYSGVDKFRRVLFADATFYKIQDPNVQFFPEKFVLEDKVDLILIEKVDTNVVLTVLQGSGNFKSVAYTDVLPFSVNEMPIIPFTTGTLPKSANRDYSLQPNSKFKDKLKLEVGPGPQTLHQYAGQWQAGRSIHNVHGNQTAIVASHAVIQDRYEKGEDWERLTFTFEDQYVMHLEGFKGNLKFFDKDMNEIRGGITDLYENRYALSIGNSKYQLQRYIPQGGMGFLDVHNRSGYTADISVSYSTEDFYGEIKQFTGDQKETNLMTLQDHYFLLPSNAKNVQILVEVWLGGDYTINIDTVDNRCIRLTGPAWDGESDWDCTPSEDAQKSAELAKRMDEDGPVKTFMEYMGDRIDKGKVDGETLGYASVGDWENVKKDVNFKKLGKKMKNSVANKSNVGSLSVGFSVAASYFIGMGVETGVLAPLSKSGEEFALWHYVSTTPSIGIQTGGAASAVFSYWMPNDGNFEDGWVWGVGAGAAAEAGMSVIGWFDFEGEFAGFTISVDFGAEGTAAAAFFSHTWYTKIY
jgi:hypothetical protein